jgi:N-acetylneuraminic acid mutarotase
MMRRAPRPQVLLVVCMLAGVPLAQKKQAGPAGPPTSSPDRAVDLVELEIVPSALDFGAVGEGDEQSLGLVLRNTGFFPLQLQRLRFLLGASGNSAAFRVVIDGKTYAGGTNSVTRTLSPPLLIPRGEERTATVTFDPSAEQLDVFTLRFEATDGNALEVDDLPVSGLGGHVGDPFLHVVIDGPSWVVDYDGDGDEAVLLDGSGSHTHEPGHVIAAYEWRVGGQVLSTAVTLATVLSAPETEIELEIYDDNVPPRSLEGHRDVRVVAPDVVPGVLAHYYDASASGPEALLDAVPAAADYIEQRPTLSVGGAGQVGGSPYTGNVLVRLVARFAVQDLGIYTLTATGGTATKLLVDEVEVSDTVFLTAGEHELEARFAVATLADMPLDVLLGQGAPGAPIEAELLTHDETGVVPVIHAMTEIGPLEGGNPITIDGFGFFPAQDVVVHWGAQDLDAADFTTFTPQRIEFAAPSGGGTIAVSVETGNGESNARTYLYQLNGPPPIQFRRDLVLSVPSPTAGVWAPDGKLYVASLDGRITALEFDEDYELVSQTLFDGVSALPNHETLSLAVNPYDPPSPVKLYVGHGDLFVNGGGTPTGPSPYTGQISVLTGPGFASPVPLITGLPVSNHDHGINGLAFDNNGDLLISVGSATNAGVMAANSGNLPESPLSAAVLKARLSKPGFNGAITYVETQTGLPNDDQRSGESVDVAPGVDVEVHAAGLRNAYGLVFTTRGRLYATDNGPNIGFGPASTGPQTQSSDPFDDDELNLVEWGNYYGSPNRSRGRYDPRQNVYYAGFRGPPSIPDTLFQMISWLPPSTDGVDEYRAATFQGQMLGNLVVQEYQSRLRRVSLKPDGRGVFGQVVIEPNTFGLGCVTGPGGAIVSLDYQNSEVEIFEPDDLTPLELVVHDIFPWRAPAAGGTPFVISGRGFGTLATTSVTIGGHAAVLTEVTWGRIRGLVPAMASPTTALLDVVVASGQNGNVFPSAFRCLLGPGSEPGRWESLASVGTSVGEVTAGVINGTMLLVGEGTGATLAYDVQNRQWLASKATRPFTGHHHAAEVVGGKLYLVGGIGGGSEGRLQIYDPSTNSWSTGADMPWGGGSVSTAAIGGKIYAAGGIVPAGFTVANCAVYDPATNVWTALAAMPDDGRNHAAAATDGTKLYAFGGRRGGNFVTNGHDSVMVYDPGTNAWAWSGDGVSGLAPLPEARGGMGKAVWLRGEFYVFGGETLDDPDANPSGVYDRVDVYDPLANAWRSEARMPNPRHGVFPVLYQGHVFLAGGGTQSGNAQSTLFDTFTRQ